MNLSSERAERGGLIGRPVRGPLEIPLLRGTLSMLLVRGALSILVVRGALVILFAMGWLVVFPVRLILLALRVRASDKGNDKVLLRVRAMDEDTVLPVHSGDMIGNLTPTHHGAGEIIGGSVVISSCI